MKSSRPHISLILPAYNEAGTIANTVGEAVGYFKSRNLRYEIVVVADGDDGTREIVRDLGWPGIVVIGSPERRGKGYGIRQAMGMVTGEIVGFADADNKVPIEEYDKFHPLLSSGEFDVVIGSRAVPGACIEREQNWYRRLGSKVFYFLVQTLVGLPGVTDSQCGFKFFQADLGKKLFTLQKIDGYMFDVEIVALMLRMKVRWKQVPIRWRDDADTRYRLVSGSVQNVKDLLKIRANLFSISNEHLTLDIPSGVGRADSVGTS